MRLIHVCSALILSVILVTCSCEGRELECPALGCCEFDCCGEGTSWDGSTQSCVLDPESPGFNGTFPPNFDFGCSLRACCEDMCCGDGTEYSQSIQCCVPTQKSADCIDSGGTVTTSNCCEGVDDFPPTCAPGPCGCSPEFSEETLVCSCPDDSCFNGTACVSQSEARCTEAGGTVTTSLCCEGVDDFPNTCLIGACGCSPENSAETLVCSCPDGLCWDGNDCVDTTPTSPPPTEESASGCTDSGGTVVTELCCEGGADFPNTCLIGACGCSPEFSEETLVCSCPDDSCFNGTACVSQSEARCTEAGGTVTTSLCCEGVDDFPNTCLIGACGCSPDNSAETLVCSCPDGLCWDGNDCVDTTPTSPPPTEESASGCTDSGGTVVTELCCEGGADFPNTCLIGACGCSPEFSEETLVCSCPDDSCFNGTACVSQTEARCTEAGGTVTTSLCCEGVDDFPNTCLIGACGCSPDNSDETLVCSCPDGLCWDGNDCVDRTFGS